MNKPIGFIIAAGNQTRFKGDMPKALSKLESIGKTPLEINIENLSLYCEKVVVVISKDNTEYCSLFKDIADNYSNITLYRIHSGKGDAHAIYEAFKIHRFRNNQRAVVCWGDSIQLDRRPILIAAGTLIDKHMIMPVKPTKDPYVNIKIEYIQALKDTFLVQAQQEKFDEVRLADHEIGYQDMCIFGIEPNTFIDEFLAYEGFKRKEYSLMSMLNETVLMDTVIRVMPASCESYSFNTLEEFEEINKEKLNEYNLSRWC